MAVLDGHLIGAFAANRVPGWRMWHIAALGMGQGLL